MNITKRDGGTLGCNPPNVQVKNIETDRVCFDNQYALVYWHFCHPHQGRQS